MKTIFLSSFMILIMQTCLAQNLELFLGGGLNQYHTATSSSSYERGFYERAQAFTAGLSVGNLRLLGFPGRLTARLDANQGYFSISHGGRGGGRSVSGDFSRMQLGIGVYPLDLVLFKRIEISIGGELQFLLAHRETGEFLVWNFAQPSLNQKVPLTDGTLFHHNPSIGLSGRIGYKINLNENWHLSPRYEIFWGLIGEVALGNDSVSSSRHFFSIGLVRSLL